MNSVKLFILFAATVLTAEATFVLGTGTLAVTGAGAGLAALLGIKAAAVGGLALGAALSRRRHYYRPSYRRARYFYPRHRYYRSVESESETEYTAELLLQASRDDGQDCGKKLVCVLNSQKNLAEDEAKIAQLFGQSGEVDVTAVTAEFDLAALMGQKAGEDHCNLIYTRCPYQVKGLMEVIRQPQMYYNQL